MKRKIIILCLALVIFSLVKGIPYGLAEDYTQIFHITKEASGAVSDYDATKIFTIPEEPLTFITNVNWQADVGKRRLSLQAAPYFKIFIIDNKGLSREEVSVSEGKKQSGTINLQPGQFCKFQLYAGKYKGLFGSKNAAEVAASCTYQTLRVTAIELNTIGSFKLAVAGPQGYKWLWTTPEQKNVPGNEIEASFKPGNVGISVSDEGLKYPFTFNLRVPEVVELNPVISGTNGYEQFPVKVTANVINHYHSTSVCSWESGVGTKLQEGFSFEHTYQKAGVYNLKLKLKNSLGVTVDKNWTVTVNPFKITVDPSIYPKEGAMPLKVRFQAKAKIYGSPSKVKYLWDFGDGTTATEESGEHQYQNAGEYKITLTTKDEFHPNLDLQPWSEVITVTKPVLSLGIRASGQSGTIPYQVQFSSNLKIEGGPTEVEYLWDFDDNTTTTLANPNHTFSEPGRYKVILTVWDRKNDTEVSKMVTVDTLPPLVTSRSTLTPLSGNAPLTVRGEAVPEISGYPTKLVYQWYIDDRPVNSGKSLQYTFASPGTYTVILRISDDLPGHSARACHTWQVMVGGQNNHATPPAGKP